MVNCASWGKKSSQKPARRCLRHVFLADSDADVLGKTVLYGGTLLFNAADSKAAGRIGSDAAHHAIVG